MGRTRIKGVELGYNFAKGPWQARAEAIFQNPRNESDDTLLLRRAKRSFTASVVYNKGPYRIGADMLASGKREDVSNVTLASFTTVNLNAGYAFAKDWRIQARMENIFDEEYELVDDYQVPGRTLLVELRYAPKGF